MQRSANLIIYCDLDGVIADFVTGSIEACNLQMKTEDVVGWAYYNPHVTHEEFWEDLPVYPWAHEFVAMLATYGDVVFCTDPTGDDDSATGKVKWLKRHGFIKPDGTNYALIYAKHLLARKDTVLLDDWLQNCDMFKNSGGYGIDFPQPWNM